MVLKIADVPVRFLADNVPQPSPASMGFIVAALALSLGHSVDEIQRHGVWMAIPRKWNHACRCDTDMVLIGRDKPASVENIAWCPKCGAIHFITTTQIPMRLSVSE